MLFCGEICGGGGGGDGGGGDGGWGLVRGGLEWKNDTRIFYFLLPIFVFKYFFTLCSVFPQHISL